MTAKWTGVGVRGGASFQPPMQFFFPFFYFFLDKKAFGQKTEIVRTLEQYRGFFCGDKEKDKERASKLLQADNSFDELL